MKIEEYRKVISSSLVEIALYFMKQFDFLLHLTSEKGKKFNDLFQYTLFPYIKNALQGSNWKKAR